MSDDESRRKVEKPQVSAAVVVTLLKEKFDLAVLEEDVQELNSYDDRNFCVQVPGVDGIKEAKYVLKIHNGVDSQNIDFIEAQNQVLCHLLACGVPCPTPLPNTHHHHVTPLTLTLAGQTTTREHACRLLTFIPGSLMSEGAQSLDLIKNVGESLGRLSRALQNFSNAALLARHHMWDLRCTADLAQFTFAIQDTHRRHMVTHTLTQFESEVLPLDAHLRRAVVHNDANDQNILVDFNTHTMIGLLDFGDILHSWQVSEIAIAMAYVMLDKEDPLQAACTLLQGYTQVFPLTSAEAQVLPVLVLSRLCCSLTLGAFSHLQDPTNHYLLLTQEPGWKVMKLLSSISIDELRQRFGEAMAACIPV